MNWEYYMSPSGVEELDSSNFHGVKFFKKLLDQNSTILVDVETDIRDFRDNAPDQLKHGYISLCLALLVAHLTNVLTADSAGVLPNYTADQVIGNLVHQIRINQNILFGEV